MISPANCGAEAPPRLSVRPLVSVDLRAGWLDCSQRRPRWKPFDCFFCLRLLLQSLVFAMAACHDDDPPSNSGSLVLRSNGDSSSSPCSIADRADVGEGSLDSHDTAPSERSTRRVYRLAIWRSFRSCVVEDKITLLVRPSNPITAARCPPGNCSKLQDAPTLRASPATASIVSFWPFMMRPHGCECAQPSRRSRWRTTRNVAPVCPGRT